MKRITISRKAYFNAAHRMFRPDWSEEENEKVFGKCANKNYHGHNYELIVSITGTIDPNTGYVMDLKKLKDYIEENIVSHFDHRNFNLDVPEFETLIPSSENIALVIYDKLASILSEGQTMSITLYETQNNFVTYPPIQ